MGRSRALGSCRYLAGNKVPSSFVDRDTTTVNKALSVLAIYLSVNYSKSYHTPPQKERCIYNYIFYSSWEIMHIGILNIIILYLSDARLFYSNILL